MDDLKDLREKAGLTQQQVFELYKIPKRTLQDWERGARKCPIYVYNFYTEKLNEIIKKNCTENSTE